MDSDTLKKYYTIYTTGWKIMKKALAGEISTEAAIKQLHDELCALADDENRDFVISIYSAVGDELDRRKR